MISFNFNYFFTLTRVPSGVGPLYMSFVGHNLIHSRCEDAKHKSVEASSLSCIPLLSSSLHSFLSNFYITQNRKTFNSQKIIFKTNQNGWETPHCLGCPWDHHISRRFPVRLHLNFHSPYWVWLILQEPFSDLTSQDLRQHTDWEPHCFHCSMTGPWVTCSTTFQHNRTAYL